VDIEDLRANTEYHKYQPTSLQVRVIMWAASISEKLKKLGIAGYRCCFKAGPVVIPSYPPSYPSHSLFAVYCWTKHSGVVAVTLALHSWGTGFNSQTFNCIFWLWVSRRQIDWISRPSTFDRSHVWILVQTSAVWCLSGMASNPVHSLFNILCFTPLYQFLPQGCLESSPASGAILCLMFVLS
jgi:hypothetical protein